MATTRIKIIQMEEDESIENFSAKVNMFMAGKKIVSISQFIEGEGVTSILIVYESSQN